MNWTACEAQGGRKGSIGQPARHRETVQSHQRGTREAGKSHSDSLGDTRDHLDSLRDTREAGKE